MHINPYLSFDGDCEAAFTFYAQCLGGTLEALLRFREMPDGEAIPAESRDKIMHARLNVDGQILMGSDSTPQCPYEPISGCSVTLNLDSTAHAERLFAALAEGGRVQMPLDRTFWAARFGTLVDRFGVPWMINCEQDQ